MTRRPIPPEVQHERSRQRYAISDALTANSVAVMWASKGDTTRANILRDVRDRYLAEITTIPPPKDTII